MIFFENIMKVISKKDYLESRLLLISGFVFGIILIVFTWNIYSSSTLILDSSANSNYLLSFVIFVYILYFILFYIIMKLSRNRKKLSDKTAELELEKTTMQHYFDIVNVMILVLDRSNNVKLLNRRGCEIIGYSSDEVIGKNWIDNFLPPSIHSEVVDVRERLKTDDNGAKYHENSVLTKNGEERLIAWRNSPLFDNKNNFIGILCSGEDITEIRRAQMELSESKEFYRTMFASLNDAVIILEDNIVKDCNRSALELFETKEKLFVGKHILDTLYDIECKEHDFYHYVDLANVGEFETAECSLRLHSRPDEMKIVEFTLSKFGAKNENKYIMVARDITKQVEEEKLFKLHVRQAQMGEMISMIAHQWRQPLSIINAITSQMRLKALLAGDETSEYVENLKNIEAQSVHLSQTISDYRNFFSVDKPKEYFSASSIVENVLNLVDHTLKSNSIELENNLVNDATVYTYRNEVLQVLIILLKNSIDMFVENNVADSKIVITIDRDDMHCKISIHDNAGGIAQHVMKKLFTPYFTTKDKNNGTGLGLYMSWLIIHEHCNGEIDVFSEEDETIFTIILPYKKEDT